MTTPDWVTVHSWTNTEEIHRAYDRASFTYSTAHDRIVGTAFDWADSILSNFESLLFWHSERVIETARRGNGLLTVAIIGGVDDDGKMILLQDVITYRPDGFPTIFADKTQITQCAKSNCLIGEPEIADEFINLRSDRALKEAKNWRLPKTTDPADYDLLKAMRYVALTIRYHIGGDVGGDLDAVEMDKDGSVRWYAKKDNCADD